MLRPIRMCHTSLIFLKSDSEKVIDAVNRKANLHLSLREMGESGTAEYVSEVESLRGRIRDLVSKTRNYIPTGASTPVCSAVSARDWKDYLAIIESEVSSYEKIIRELEDAAKIEERLAESVLLWKSIASGTLGSNSLETLSQIKAFSFIFARSEKSSISDLRSLLPQTCVVVEASAEPIIVLVVCLKSQETHVMQQLESAGFRSIALPEEFKGSLSQFSTKLEALESALENTRKIKAERISLLEKNHGRLLYIEQSVSDASSILSVKGKSSYSKNWALLEGYVPKDHVKELMNSVQQVLNGRLVSFVNEDLASASVPVSFKYPRFFKIFDSITNLYGSPSYNEVNPTPIMALSFPILFGLMFGDLGHGISLALLGLVFYRFFGSMKKIGLVLVIAGLAGAIIGALLYGEFFGQSLHHLVGYEPPLHPSEDLMTMLKISLFVGVAHISLGLSLSFANSLIQKRYSTAFLVNLPKLALYVGFIYVVFAFGLNLMEWFSGPIYYILGPIAFLFVAEPFYEIAKHGKKGIGKLGEMFFEIFETMISFISNTVSYLRIFAMVVAHIMLTTVFYSLAEITSGGSLGFVLSPLLIVVGNVFVVLLEGILVLAQDLRLHFYEWFSKFYNDGGVRFSPFRLAVGVPIQVSK
ncbi:MAG: V-type ATPase 116kDa subunit family protein [Candidatus Methanosuratincola sp.]